MKTRLFLLAIFLFTALSNAQTEDNYLFSINDTKLGGYVSLGGRYSTLDSEDAGFLDFKAAVVFESGWAVGLAGSGLYYDKSLSRLVSDGTYHLEAAYGGVFVEKMFSFNKDFKFSLYIISGSGTAEYTYDKEYREDKTWTEETIDKTTFFIFEPGIEIQHRVAGNWWIGVNGSYRNTSPLELIDTDENLFRKFSAGITVKYGIF